MTLLLLLSVASAADRVAIDPNTFPYATCNDGSAPVFYVQLADPTSPNLDRWVLHFDDAADPCSTDVECAERADPLGSDYPSMGTGCALDALGVMVCEQQIGVYGPAATTPPYGPTRALGGLLSDDVLVNPDFADWNHVQVVSCSSDLWAGDGGTLAVAGFPSITNPGVVEFHGAAIAAAVIQTLAMGYGMYTAEEILAAGTGEGAAGAQNHLDRLAEFLPTIGMGAQVRGVIDGGAGALYRHMLDPASGTVAPDHGCAARISTGNAPSYAWYEAAFVTWGARADQSCVDALHDPNAPGAEGPCLSQDFLFSGNWIETPFVYRQDFYDPVGVAAFTTSGGDPDPDACFNQVMHHRGLAAQRAEAMEGYFMPCGGSHAGVDDDAAFSVHEANEHTLAEILDNWVNGTGRVTRAAEPGCLLYP